MREEGWDDPTHSGEAGNRTGHEHNMLQKSCHPHPPPPTSATPRRGSHHTDTNAFPSIRKTLSTTATTQQTHRAARQSSTHSVVTSGGYRGYLAGSGEGLHSTRSVEHDHDIRQLLKTKTITNQEEIVSRKEACDRGKFNICGGT